MIVFLKYLRGYLRIRVWGFSPERFMNLCSNKGILLWNITRQGDAYEMCIDIKGFRQLRPIVRKTGTRAVILERYGLPFFLPGLWKRKLFLVGLFLASFFWLFSSLFIWNITLTGNEAVTGDVFYSFLEEQEIRIGMKKNKLNIEELEKEIRRNFPRVTWASARLSGTRLLIDIKENDAPILTDVQEEEECSSLVSEYGGTVVSILVRSGVPLVKAGDIVEEGQVLVDGRVPIYGEDAAVKAYYPVKADGDILLEHTRYFSARLSFDYIKKEYTGREKKHYYLKVGSGKLGFPVKQSFLVQDSLMEESRPLLFEKLSVPVYFGIRTDREYANVERSYSLQEAEEELNKKIFSFIASLEEKGVQIIEKNVKINTNSASWVVEGEFLVREAVGTSQKTDWTEVGVTERE